MIEGLVKESSVFISKGVGVYTGTPANYVLDLIGQLLYERRVI